MPDIESEIRKVFQETEKVENDARKLEARIGKIEGAGELLPKRRYGTPVDGQSISGNITLSSLINSKDPELASYLGILSGSHRAKEEEEAARSLHMEAMRLATEKLRAKNEASRTHREKAFLANVDPTTGRSNLYSP